MSTVLFTATIVILIVFGGIAFLVFLALSSNKEVGASAQTTKPETGSQQKSDSGKWGKWFGWIFFGFIVLDLWRKFVFPAVPVEWEEWVPSFSWNTFEILAALVGVYFLWKKVGKKPKEVTKTDEGKKSECKKEAVPGNNNFAENMVIVVILLCGIFFLWPVLPYETPPPVPTNGMLYFPLYGLVKAFMVTVLIGTLWSFFDKTESVNGAIFAILLSIGGLVVSYLSIERYWFAPVAGDPLVPTLAILGGIVTTVILICFTVKNEVEYVIIFLFGVVAVWLPQFWH